MKKNRPITHGARSRRVMRKWTDKRCRQGKELAAILAGIEDDIGPLSVGQKVILRNVAAKLAIVKQITEWAERQPSVVENGRLLPILGENFVTYTSAVQRGIVALYDLAKKPKERTLDLQDYIRGKGDRNEKEEKTGPGTRG